MVYYGTQELIACSYDNPEDRELVDYVDVNIVRKVNPMTTLPQVIHQLATDPAFRAKVAAGDPQVLAGLPPEEQALLLTLRHLLALSPQALARRMTDPASPTPNWPAFLPPRGQPHTLKR